MFGHTRAGVQSAKFRKSRTRFARKMKENENSIFRSREKIILDSALPSIVLNKQNFLKCQRKVRPALIYQNMRSQY